MHAEITSPAVMLPPDALPPRSSLPPPAPPPLPPAWRDRGPANDNGWPRRPPPALRCACCAVAVDTGW